MKPRTLAITIHRWARPVIHSAPLLGITLGWFTVLLIGDSLLDFYRRTNDSLRDLCERMSRGGR